MKVGTEAYNIDHEQTHARGVLVSESDLHKMLAGPVNKIINDTQGKSDIRVLLSSVVNTGFENAALESLLHSSATGADLVGFQRTGDPDTPYRFAFGE